MQNIEQALSWARERHSMYTQRLCCGNCGHEFVEYIKKGSPVNPRAIKCPHCAVRGHCYKTVRWGDRCR
jgi:DNA-directed RNA polymerase subunit RPC12/RpoP